jgi:hypothetical protein
VRYALLSYGGEADTTLATTVRVRGGETLIADGSFGADAVGVSVIDAESLDDAIELAAELPAARSGAVEIRPVDE